MDDEVDEFLAHFGVKGMRWGVRKDAAPGVRASTNRDAKKDANEFARAKMFYGEGAGTRRKLIKATVESKSKRDPDYKKAFDHHLNNQDLGKRASQARGERKRKDAVSKTGKTARGVYRSLNGGFGTVSMASAAVAGAYLVAKQNGYDQVVANAAKTTYRTVVNNVQARKLAEEFLRGR